jgi:GT2 family glycosyltransferase
MALHVVEGDGRPDISVVIVSFHCRDQLLACLESLVASGTSRSLEAIVVDNGSTDGTLDMLERWDQRRLPLRLVALGYNAGFSRAVNVGVGAAGGRQLLLLNPDTVVERGSLDTLADWLDCHPRAGAVAPLLLNPDGTDQGTARSFPTPAAALFGRRSPLTRLFPGNRWSVRFLSGRDRPEGKPFVTDWVSGAAIVVPRQVVDEVGMLDDSFFLFWEDADYCRRLADAGYEVWSVPEARVVHDEGGTRGHAWRPQVVVHFHRGAYRYWAKRHAAWWWAPLRAAAAALLAGRALSVVVLQATKGLWRSASGNPGASVRALPPTPSPRVGEL